VLQIKRAMNLCNSWSVAKRHWAEHSHIVRMHTGCRPSSAFRQFVYSSVC